MIKEIQCIQLWVSGVCEIRYAPEVALIRWRLFQKHEEPRALYVERFSFR